MLEVQNALNRAGCDCGPADGIMGARTRNAVRAFQASRGLVADGIIGPQTLGALGLQSSPSPATGSGTPGKTATTGGVGGASSFVAPATKKTQMWDNTWVEATPDGFQGMDSGGVPIVGTHGGGGTMMNQPVAGQGWSNQPKPDTDDD